MRPRSILIGLSLFGLLGGCASLEAVAASARDNLAYDRYGRDVVSELGRTSALGADRFSCDGEACLSLWTGVGITDYWRRGSSERCRAEHDGWICVAVRLEPPRGGGSYQEPLNVRAMGPQPAKGRPFAPRMIEIDGLDQPLWVY